jgi:hypothetical protein
MSMLCRRFIEEVRGQRIEDRGQRTEDRGQKIEVGNGDEGWISNRNNREELYEGQKHQV